MNMYLFALVAWCFRVQLKRTSDQPDSPAAPSTDNPAAVGNFKDFKMALESEI